MFCREMFSSNTNRSSVFSNVKQQCRKSKVVRIIITNRGLSMVGNTTRTPHIWVTCFCDRLVHLPLKSRSHKPKDVSQMCGVHVVFPTMVIVVGQSESERVALVGEVSEAKKSLRPCTVCCSYSTASFYSIHYF